MLFRIFVWLYIVESLNYAPHFQKSKPDQAITNVEIETALGSGKFLIAQPVNLRKAKRGNRNVLCVGDKSRGKAE